MLIFDSTGPMIVLKLMFFPMNYHIKLKYLIIDMFNMPCAIM